jgi:tRNA threonylcarbamoyladenosine biosynthesis protein TsaE
MSTAEGPPYEGLQIVLGSEADTERLGRALAGAVGPGSVIGLVGPLGAGKTRLARAVATGLGVDPLAVTSPTFTLIHEYEGRLPVYHFDAYRLGGPEPFEELGVADYWDAGGVCLVEWADLVAGLLPASSWWVEFEPGPGGTETRLARLRAPGGSGAAAVLTALRSEIDAGSGGA